jgi:hypothetical protein
VVLPPHSRSTHHYLKRLSNPHLGPLPSAVLEKLALLDRLQDRSTWEKKGKRNIINYPHHLLLLQTDSRSQQSDNHNRQNTPKGDWLFRILYWLEVLDQYMTWTLYGGYCQTGRPRGIRYVGVIGRMSIGCESILRVITNNEVPDNSTSNV